MEKLPQKGLSAVCGGQLFYGRFRHDRCRCKIPCRVRGERGTGPAGSGCPQYAADGAKVLVCGLRFHVLPLAEIGRSAAVQQLRKRRRHAHQSRRGLCAFGRGSKEAFPHCHGSHAQPPRRAEGRGMRGNVRFSRKAGRNERADLQAGEGVLSRDRHVYLRKAFRNERV